MTASGRQQPAFQQRAASKRAGSIPALEAPRTLRRPGFIARPQPAVIENVDPTPSPSDGMGGVWTGRFLWREEWLENLGCHWKGGGIFSEPDYRSANCKHSVTLTSPSAKADGEDRSMRSVDQEGAAPADGGSRLTSPPPAPPPPDRFAICPPHSPTRMERRQEGARRYTPGSAVSDLLSSAWRAARAAAFFCAALRPIMLSPSTRAEKAMAA